MNISDIGNGITQTADGGLLAGLLLACQQE
jgi:hypothetical protein